MRRSVIAVVGLAALAIAAGGYLAFPRSTKTPAAVAELPRSDRSAAAKVASAGQARTVPRFAAPPTVPDLRDQATANYHASQARMWQRRRDEAVAAMGLNADEAMAYDEIADRTNEAFAARAMPAITAALEVARTETDPAKRDAARKAAQDAVLPLFKQAQAELRALYKQPPVGQPAHPVGLLDAENGRAFGELIQAYAKTKRSYTRDEFTAQYAAEKAKRGL